jgi:hypothetical protein
MAAKWWFSDSPRRHATRLSFETVEHRAGCLFGLQVISVEKVVVSDPVESVGYEAGCCDNLIGKSAI